MKIVIAGGTGFVGRALCRALARRGTNLVVLTREPGDRRPVANEAFLKFDDGSTEWREAIDGADAVVNLAGEGIADRPWTSRRMTALRDSRVETTKALVGGIADAAEKPKVLVSASAVGYYGDRGDEVLDEESLPGDDFLARLCVDWEDAARRAEEHGTPVSRVRIGVVLDAEGGALRRMIAPFRMYLGGRLGSGRQWMSWIQREDLAALLKTLILEPRSGVFNGTAPNPARNADFVAALGGALGRPAVLPAPAPALKVLLGRMSSVLLASQRALPRAALDAGFAFKHPELAGALEASLPEEAEA